ncbi:agmatinase [Weizmannia acidilactici]|uniref:Agmatinase n=1 Tax=Weizmannia acidilactici TaxID=2607726 RepID=A0A5J4J5X1_9BACI|nr:agmatinase [Weizmannia acidilactici]GER67095.1 agmatinase [Weizmannia acidilactici]GER70336.1 agmatinase [Weizmannia acidilactici]
MHYPLSPDIQPEFCSNGTFMRLPCEDPDAKLAVIGLPFDTAASYRTGARFAPQAIRQSSMTLFPYHPVFGNYPFEETHAIDAGDVPVIPHNIGRSYALMEERIGNLMEKGIIPIGLGGDHSVTLAGLRAAAKHFGPLAMIHFDAHTDTWDTYYGEKYWHGSTFIRAYEEGLLQPSKVFQLGIRGTLNHPGDVEDSRRLGFHVITTSGLDTKGFGAVLQEMKTAIGDTPCFLTFDIDFVDPSCAPGTGTMEAGGFSSRETLKMVRALKGFHFVGFDLVEVLPQYDAGQITSLLAATLVHDFAGLAALRLKRDEPVFEKASTPE